MLGDSWRPLDCVFCSNPPQKTPIYSCKAGHLVCASCYAVLFHQTDSNKKIHLIHCKLCNAEITNTRNLIAELLVENAQNSKFDKVLTQNVKRSPASGSSSDTTDSSYRDNKPHTCVTSDLSITGDSCSMLHSKSASRRPICCPEYSCRHMVAVQSLVSHFEFEHPRTLKLELVPDVREDFVVSCDIFNRNYYYLIALLLIGNDHEKRRSRTSMPVHKNVKHLRTKVCTHLPVSLLCSIVTLPIKPATIPCNETAIMNVLSQVSFVEGKCPNGGPSTSSNSSNQLQSSGSAFNMKMNKELYNDCISTSINDFIILWASALDTELTQSIRCTIEISDFEHKLLYRYHGNLNSIRDSQEPRAVFIRGNCLIVQSNVLTKIISEDEEFIVSVVIHYEKDS